MSYTLRYSCNLSSPDSTNLNRKELVVKHHEKNQESYYVLDFADNKSGRHANAKAATFLVKNSAEQLLAQFKNKSKQIYLDLSLSGMNVTREQLIERLVVA